MNKETSLPAVLVCSYPKSGTYLLAELLESLGYVNSHWHISVNSWQDYSGATVEQMRNQPKNYTFTEPCLSVIRRIKPGHFAVSHLGPRCVLEAGNVTKIVVVRGLRDALPSWCRWIWITDRWTNTSGWKNEENVKRRFRKFIIEFRSLLVFSYWSVFEWVETGAPYIRFEDLNGQNGVEGKTRAAQTLADILNNCLSKEVLNKLDVCLQSETKTAIKKREGDASYNEYWNFRTNIFYYASGMYTIDADLGYEKKSYLKFLKSKFSKCFCFCTYLQNRIVVKLKVLLGF